MDELRRRAYPEPWGRTGQGDEPGVDGRDARRRAPSLGAPLSAQRRHPRRRRQRRLAAARRAASSRCSATGSRSTVPEPAEQPAPNGSPHIDFEANQCHIGIAFPSVPYRDPQYLQAWAAVGVLSRRHELAAVHRGPREARPVLHRAAPRCKRSSPAPACCATPARPPSGPRKRSTSPTPSWCDSASGIEQGGTRPAQGPHQERPDHAAGVDVRPAAARSPATGTTWAASARSRSWAARSTRSPPTRSTPTSPSTRRATSPSPRSARSRLQFQTRIHHDDTTNTTNGRSC